MARNSLELQKVENGWTVTMLGSQWVFAKAEDAFAKVYRLLSPAAYEFEREVSVTILDHKKDTPCR